VYPPITLTPAETDRVVEATTVIARLLKAVGLINIQFVIQDGIPHVLEVNPRASRTVPFLSKVTGVPMVNLATHAAPGRSLREFGFWWAAAEPPAVCGQGARLLHGQAAGRRRRARPGDEVDG